MEEKQNLRGRTKRWIKYNRTPLCLLGAMLSIPVVFSAHIYFSPKQQQPQAQEQTNPAPNNPNAELIHFYKIMGVTETVCPEESPHYNPALCNEKKRELTDHLDNSLYMRKYFMNHP